MQSERALSSSYLVWGEEEEGVKVGRLFRTWLKDSVEFLHAIMRR